MPKRWTHRRILKCSLALVVILIAGVVVVVGGACIITTTGFFDKLSPGIQRQVLHIALLAPVDHHDDYIHLIYIGDESSVPFLIWSLRWEERSPDGSMVCTKAHCLEALEQITNNDPGCEHEDWQRWWRANRRKSRREWIFDGFKAAGYVVSDPLDEESICVLLAASVDRAQHLRDHAQALLDRVPPSTLLRCAHRATESQSPKQRLGGATALTVIGGEGTIERLRLLTADKDAIVARCTLGLLNSVLRREMPSCHEACLVWRGTLPFRPDLVQAVSSENTVLLVHAGSSRMRNDAGMVLAFNLAEKKPAWHYELPGPLAEGTVGSGSRIFLACADDSVHCLDASTGALLWQREREPSAQRKRRVRPPASPGTFTGHVAATGDRVFLACADGCVRCLDASSGVVLWERDKEPLTCQTTPRRPPGSGALAALTELGGSVGVLDGGLLWAFDQTNGHTLWSLPGERIEAGPFAVRDALYALTARNTLLRISLTGEALAGIVVGDPHTFLLRDSFCQVVVAEETVCVVTGHDRGEIACYSIPSLSKLWQREVGQVHDSFLLSQDCYIVRTSYPHAILALDRSSGTPLWGTQERATLLGLVGPQQLAVINSKRKIELRSVRTGEVQHLYKEPVLDDYPWASVCGDLIVALDKEGRTWFLRLPDAASEPDAGGPSS
ncbi:MAG: PQQ-binding-like beta-propeller repeat protein [Verrucomicrobia bacterium]|nr:PQQ-binding-like beta-propeller repeat protein [Verrucomicrobiota bacterium]